MYIWWAVSWVPSVYSKSHIHITRDLKTFEQEKKINHKTTGGGHRVPCCWNRNLLQLAQWPRHSQLQVRVPTVCWNFILSQSFEKYRCCVNWSLRDLSGGAKSRSIHESFAIREKRALLPLAIYTKISQTDVCECEWKANCTRLKLSECVWKANFFGVCRKLRSPSKSYILAAQLDSCYSESMRRRYDQDLSRHPVGLVVWETVIGLGVVIRSQGKKKL